MSRIFSMPVAEVYGHYVAKVERKGRTRHELDAVLCWATGYSHEELHQLLEAGTTFRDFFVLAPMHPDAERVTGVVCGVRVEEVADPLMRNIRILDKLVDELARGKSLDNVMRTPKQEPAAKELPAMRPTGTDLAEVLAGLPTQKRRDAEEICSMMGKITGEEPVVWAKKILGFGTTGAIPLAAVAPTARHNTVYLSTGYQELYPELVANLVVDPQAKRGNPKYSVACLYLTNLASVHRDVLAELIRRSATDTQREV